VSGKRRPAGSFLVLRGHNGPVKDLSFVADGSELATASVDGTVRVWNVTPAGSRDLVTLDAHPGGVESVAFNPTNRRVLTTGIVEAKAKLWDARTGALLSSNAIERDEISRFFLGHIGQGGFVEEQSADGRLGLSVDSTGRAKLRSLATGDVLATFGSRVQSAAFDSNGIRVALGDSEGEVQIWDLTHPRKPVAIRSFAAHKGIVEAVTFSRDGRLFGTAGEDTTAKLWDIRTGKNVLTLTGHTRFLTSIAFSTDGKRIVTGSGDGTVRIYVLPVDALMALARSRLTRGWTKVECAQYLPGGRCPRRP
jgi:WD40 repeat protein